MKKIFIVPMAVVITVLSISPLSKAKGSRSDNSYKSYNKSPKEHSVSGYSRKDGTYVAPYERTNRDGARNNNWTTEGNTNPNTGKEGTIPRSRYEKSK